MQCRICGNKEANQEYHVKEMMFGYKDIFPYFQCSKCGCLQIKNLPQDLSRYYPEDYYSYRPSSATFMKKFFVRLRNAYAVHNRGIVGKYIYSKYPHVALKSLSRIHPSNDSSILDVGCGSGNLLHSLQELGFRNLLGIDPCNKKDIEYKNGLKIQKKEIHQVKGAWDVIMFHHSFEHISDPAETLQRVHHLLKPEGYCIIRIPIVSSFAWKHYGVHWVQLDAPRHLFLHSVDSMKLLACKNNFDLCDVIYDSGALQFWGSILYKKDISPGGFEKDQKNSFFLKKDIKAFSKHAEELNVKKQGDQAVFYLRKINEPVAYGHAEPS